MRATIRIDHLREVRGRYDAMGRRARRPEPALRAAGTLADLRASERRRFAKRISPAASRDWVREKRRRGLDPRTLRATGKLERLIEGAGMGISAYNGELRWTAKDAYAARVANVHASRRRSWRVVVIDKPARQSISDRVLTYILDGSIP